MYEITNTNNLRRDFKDYKYNQKVIEELSKIVEFVTTDVKLPKKYRNHSLKGSWKGYSELHVLSDVLLIYEKDEDKKLITLVAIGSHSDLFH